MTITLTQTVKTSVEKQIPVPSFWKDSHGLFLGFLDENTVARVSIYDDYACVINGTPEKMQYHMSIDNMTEASESEFLNAYDEAWEACRLIPKEETINDSLNRIIPSREKTY